jgi:hypothetical protein
MKSRSEPASLNMSEFGLCTAYGVGSRIPHTFGIYVFDHASRQPVLPVSLHTLPLDC